MGLQSLVQRLYNSQIGSQGVTYVTYPAAAAATTLTGGKSYAYGAWAQLVVAATITADVWLTGVELSAATLADDFEVQVGSGTAPAGTAIATLPMAGADYTGVYISLRFPVRIASGNGIVARAANASAAVANTIGARATVAWGV